MIKKIVIAEDDLTSRMILTKGVEAKGIAAIQCGDGAMAWQVLEENPDVAMLITDVVMPGIDGRDLVKRVRENNKLKEIPVLIVSGAVGPKAIAGLLDLGATAFLSKPISVDDLHDYIDRNIDE